MILVSVCCITYNHEKYIARAIEGFLMQKTSFPFEIIIHDDASTDNTANIIREYAERDSRIKPILRDTNIKSTGVAVFPITFKMTQGKYIAMCEGDDYWTDPLKLQKQFDFMESHPDFSLCYHRIKWIYTYDTPHVIDAESNINDPAESTIYDILKKGWFIRTCSMFMVKIEIPPGFDGLFIGDYPLHFLLADKGKIGFLNECMGVYRINDKGMSQTILAAENLKSLQKNIKHKIAMFKYLNQATQFKYNKEIKEKVANEMLHLLSVTFKRNKIEFLSEVKKIIENKEVNFIFTAMKKKLRR